MQLKRGSERAKQIAFYFVLALAAALVFGIVAYPADSACGRCDGASVCMNTDVCCGVQDGKCPSDFGDWVAAACNVGIRGVCQTDDFDCCKAPAQWDPNGWPGYTTRNIYGFGQTLNKCCGDERNGTLSETVMQCEFNATQYPDPCSTPCASNTCAQISSQGCCDQDTDCFDPFEQKCYNSGEVAYVNKIFTRCTNKTWSKGLLNDPCANGTTDCRIGLCIDTDYNGMINSFDKGICGDCNSATNPSSMCGALALGNTTGFKGSEWYVCTGAGAKYRCYDQLTNGMPGNLPCIENSALGDETDTSAGGLVVSNAIQGRNYIRCSSKGVCNGSANMAWTTRPAESISIGGGTCSQLDTMSPAAILTDQSDATSNRLSIAHDMLITLSDIYQATSPASWKFLFGCWISPAIGGRSACNQTADMLGNNPYSWSTFFTAPGSTSSASFSFRPRCNSSYIGTKTISFASTYTGFFADNLWRTASASNVKTFDVVSCESDLDAQSVANFNTSSVCAPGLACSNSYCDENYNAIPCPSDLDDTRQCKDAFAPTCCSRAGYRWLEKGETFAFGNYADNLGNKDIVYADTGNPSERISECCGNNPGEYQVFTVAYDNLIPNDFRCCSRQLNVCVAAGFCNDNSAAGGHEDRSYLGDALGVGPQSSCFDGVDNDCDGTTDFCDGQKIICDGVQSTSTINTIDPAGAYKDRRDNDCTATIRGAVTDASGNPLGGAIVRAKQRGSLNYQGKTYTNLDYQNTTNSAGEYSLVVNGNIEYEIIAGHFEYEPSNPVIARVGFREPKIINVQLSVPSQSDCKNDCTKGSSTLCDPGCDLRNGCVYPADERLKSVCTGKKPGFKVTYSDDPFNKLDAICCTGPIVQKESAVKLDKKVITDRKNIVRITRPIILDGKPVNMVIDVFS